MNKQLYSNYSLKDFNQFDCLKLSIGIYAILAFVTRGYIVWIMSISNMNNQTDTIEMIFPDPKMFYLSLVSGALGLFVFLIISLRRPNAALWIKFCWQHIRKFLLCALVVDLTVSVIGYFYLSLLSYTWLLIQIVITLVLVVFLYTNKKVKLNIKEFPEEIEK
ncbi:DUF2919 family protein [Pseudocolwellia sp. AS88]|jgi:hypothetical protein|uniref:DUF2919 family protein n=1 Tax=Pseudocolwellia TaxID=2848177 RepID=UPI0026EC16EB|nr:DUF2919 family protein [Pseudocolwellia sp. AS88]MDO7084514.1 DUF2919 family protein [Pseudocolwellia sp. AS88]